MTRHRMEDPLLCFFPETEFTETKISRLYGQYGHHCLGRKFRFRKFPVSGTRSEGQVLQVLLVRKWFWKFTISGAPASGSISFPISIFRLDTFDDTEHPLSFWLFRYPN
jgi:hypothetical protein